MSFTHEDVLRELELLPVWQLRVPLPHIENAPENLVEKITPKIVEIASEIVTVAEVATATETSQKSFEMHISEDKNWLFICPESLMDAGSQRTLFNNILSALHIKKVQIYQQDLALVNVRVIVAMGEKTAQTVLNTQDSIDHLRGSHLKGNWHVLHNTPLIVTYSCAEILEHLPNKAKTWDDLVVALTIVST